MAQRRAVVSLFAVLVVSLGWLACEGDKIPTGTARVRAPNVAFNGVSLDSLRKCDGSFSGSGTIGGVYAPGPPPNAVKADVTLSIANDNTTSGFVPMPGGDKFEITVQNPDKGFNFSGQLTDPCKQGVLTFGGKATGEGPPGSPANVVVTVAAVGFKVASGIDVAEISNSEFDVKFTLACCPGAAGAFKVTWDQLVNVASLTCNPAAQVMNCPGGNQAFVLHGVKTKEKDAASLAIHVTPPVAVGTPCKLGSALVEGR